MGAFVKEAYAYGYRKYCELFSVRRPTHPFLARRQALPQQTIQRKIWMRS